MGTYFTNETLDALWARLVTATNNLIFTSSSEGWGPVVFDNSNMQGYVDLYPEFNVLTTIDAVEYTIYNASGLNVKSGFGDYDPGNEYNNTTPLTDLPNGAYTVKITHESASMDSSIVGLTGTLIIGSISTSPNTGMKGIHDALLSHFGLTHDNTPTTAGDYMKGIAVAARYKQQGYINPNPSELWSLEQIVEAFEEKYTLILYENGDWTLVPSAYDGNIFLYDADTEESWFVAGAATISSGNVSEYMQQGHRYYLAGEVQESQDKSHLVRSNTVEALVTPNFDIMVSVEPTGDSYEVSVDVLDPGYSPTPDTITIEIYDETDMTDFVGSQTWHNTNSVTADVREIASQLHQDSWYRVVATAKKTGFNDASAESYFTWSYGETEGEFTISAHIDETTVVISVSAFDNVIYGYSFILYDEYGNYISDTYRDAPGEFEYYPSLDSLFGTGLYEGSAYGLQITADGADGKTATTYITFTYGVSK